MIWQIYETNFIEDSLKAGLSPSKATKLLLYAKFLHSKSLPIIYDTHHLCLLVGYKDDYVIGASKHPNAYYRNFRIKKKNGSTRVISEPLPSLKEIQDWVLNNILNFTPVSDFAKAYVKGRSIKENARFHRKQNNVLTVDVKNFFGSIKLSDVINIFSEMGYNKEVSLLLGKLCCKNGSLPQGSPTSPALSNIFLNSFDNEIFEFCLKRKIRFTRYADDITFSYWNNNFTKLLIDETKKGLKSKNLSLNNNKTRLMSRHQRQEVTGVVVNEKMQVPIEVRKHLRQVFYYIEKYGLDSHIAKIQEKRRRYLYHLIGLCNFVTFINPSDLETSKYKSIASEYLNEVGR